MAYRLWIYSKSSSMQLLLILCLCGRPGVASCQELPGYRKLTFPELDSLRIDSGHLFSLIHESNLLARRNADSAIMILENVVVRSHGSGFYDGIVEGSYFLGYIHTQKGIYNIAREWFQHALIYSVKGRRTPFKACRILINIGNTYQFEGNYKQAATYYFHAAELAEKTVKTDIAIASPLIRIYNNAGFSLLQFGKYEKAMYYFDKAEAIAAGWQLPINLPGIWVNKAIVYRNTGHPEKAREYNRKALHLAEHYENAEAHFIALQNMADLCRDSGHTDQAIIYLKQALQTRSNLNPYYTTKALYSLGSIYLSQKDYGRAKEYLTASFRQAAASNIPEHQLRIHQQLALLNDRTQDYREAFHHQQQAYQINDSLINQEKTVVVDLLEIKYRTAEKDKILAQNQLMIDRQKNHLRQKNIWIYGIASAVLLLLLLLFSLYRINRHKQKIRILKAVIEGEEKERSRIARELHDGIGGLASALAMNINLLGKEKQISSGETYLNVLHITDEISNEIRKTAHNLMPEILIRHSLPEAIQLFCNHVNKGELETDIQAYGPFELLDQDIRLSLYRIMQELIQNILKHAHASHALIQMILQEQTLCIIVEDNGVGMEHREDTDGMGLQSLRSRVQSMNGQISIESEKGKGTTILIEFNLPKG